MTYIPDGANEDYSSDRRIHGIPFFKNIYAWGWLNNKQSYTKKWESQELKKKIIAKLKDIDPKFVVDHYMGAECCGFCLSYEKTGKRGYQFEGSIKISHNKKVYCCPQGVKHYIEEHDYKPPNEVIDAILNGHYYTYRELKKLGEKDPEVQKIKLAEKKRIKNLKKKWEKEDKVFKKERIKLINDPNWRNKLQKAMLQGMGFK